MVMAVTDSYATAAYYRSLIDKKGNQADGLINDQLEAKSRFVERHLHRFFTRDAAAATRVYMPKSTGRMTREDWAESENPWKYGPAVKRLYVDDLVSVTSITIDTDADGSFADDDALESTDYELLPRNAADGPEPKPYNAIQLTPWGTVHSFPAGCRVQVVGVFGAPSVPEMIRQEVCRLTAFDRGEADETWSRQEILDGLMRAYGKVVV